MLLLTWLVRSAGSSASGTCGTDTVTVGHVAITNQVVEIANKLSPTFVNGSGCDGLIGFAFVSLLLLIH